MRLDIFESSVRYTVDFTTNTDEEGREIRVITAKGEAIGQISPRADTCHKKEEPSIWNLYQPGWKKVDCNHLEEISNFDRNIAVEKDKEATESDLSKGVGSGVIKN